MTTESVRIFFPMIALVGLTFFVLLLIPFVRVRAVRSGAIDVNDFKFGESSRVPPDVSIPNRNYMSLLELPILFYAVCLSMYVTRRVDDTAVVLAWVYVGLRHLHSAIHLTYNRVVHRLLVFATSNIVLAAIWARFLSSLT
jgi:hypothetical protein